MDKLLGGIPKLRDAFKSFADWLNDLTGNLYEMFTFPARNAANSIGHFIEKTDDNIAGRLRHQRGDGVAAALRFIVDLLDPELFYEVGKAIGDFFINLQWVEIFGGLTPIDLVHQLDHEIERRLDTIADCLAKLCPVYIFHKLVDLLGDAIGIHSPSTVFAEIGGFLIAGLVQGISDTWHTITDFFSEKLGSLKQTLTDSWGIGPLHGASRL